MGKKRRVIVYCWRCGWKGRRVPGECACYDEWAIYCACTFGYCSKCPELTSRLHVTRPPTPQKRPARPLDDLQRHSQT